MASHYDFKPYLMTCCKKQGQKDFFFTEPVDGLQGMQECHCKQLDSPNVWIAKETYNDIAGCIDYVQNISVCLLTNPQNIPNFAIFAMSHIITAARMSEAPQFCINFIDLKYSSVSRSTESDSNLD